MRILQINKFYYIKGGPERVMMNTADLLRAKGHQVAFFAMRHPLNIASDWDECFVSGIDYDEVSGPGARARLFVKTLYSREAEHKIRDLIHAFSPDIAHVHNFHHQLTPSILFPLRRARIPVVVTLHDYKMVCPSYTMLNHGKTCELCKGGRFFWCARTKCHKDSFGKSLLATLESYLHHAVLGSYRSVSAWISPSQFLLRKSREMGLRGSVVYLPNFVPMEGRAATHACPSNRIAYCGRLAPEKGIRTLIEAVRDLPVMLDVCGGGPQRAELEDLARSRSMRNVVFHGHLSRDALLAIMQESLFTILPSEWYENNPLAVLEAFMLGKPVIGARIGGIPELVINGETGYTFESRNVQDLRGKIEYLLHSPEKITELGNRARELVEDEYNAEKHYQGLMRIYNTAIEESKAR